MIMFIDSKISRIVPFEITRKKRHFGSDGIRSLRFLFVVYY